VESLGDKLRVAREEKGFGYEHVGRDTNIARRYLEALENEDFDKFPGEAYLLGFLRNYGEYLGLDVNELLSLYRAIKIQEQPVPVEQLLRNIPTVPRFPFIVLAVFAVLALAGGVYWLLAFKQKPDDAAEQQRTRVPAEYTLADGRLEERLYRGETVRVPLGEDNYRVELRETGDPLTLNFPHGSVELMLSRDTEVDLNGDGFNDIMVTLLDYDRALPSSGASIRFAVNSVELLSSAPLTEQQAAAVRTGTPVFVSSTPYPFTLQVQFQGYCMFRWAIDRRDRNERYFSRGDMPLTLQAQNGVRLWVSNANALQMQITGAGRTVPLEIGAAGEVVAAELRWFRDDDGRYRLSHYRLD
jgi:cytoskeletal protein RodZ